MLRSAESGTGQAQVKIRRIKEVRYPNVRQTLGALSRGEVAAVEHVPPDRVAELAANPEFKVGRYARPRLHRIALDGRNPALRNRTLRRGLSYAIDRRTLLEETLLHRPSDAVNLVSDGVFPKGNYADAPDVKPLGYDPLLARMLVAAARKELGGQPIKLTLEYPAIPEAQAVVPRLVEAFRLAGVEVVASERPESELEAELRAGRQFDLAYRATRCDEPVIDAGPMIAPGYDAPPGHEPARLASRARGSCNSCSSSSALPSGPRPRGSPSRSTASAATSCPSFRSGSSRTTTPGGPGSRGRRTSRTSFTKGSPRGRSNRGSPRTRGDGDRAGPEARSPGGRARGRPRARPGRSRRVAQLPKAAEPLDRQPYRIRLILTIDPEARFDARRRDVLLGDWRTLVRRFVGAPWKVEIAEESQASVIGSDLESIQTKDLAEVSQDVDKVWVVRLGAEGSGLVFSGRELDVSTDRLGPIQRRPAAVVRDAPARLFQFTLELFSPYAEIGESFGKNVALIVRGVSIAPATPIGRVVSEGTIFLPLRIVPRKDGTKQVREIVNTFLRVEDVQGAAVRCAFVSLYSNPFTKMVVQKTSLAAIGVKPGRTPTRLRFVTLPDRAPAAGYVLTARSYPDGVPREVGTTDREGRVVIDPTVADSLLVLRLLAGNSEPMYEFPLMPGLSAAERTMPPFDPKPLAVALETQLDSLRDAVIDLVAVRARLEARLKARFDGEDYKGAEEAMNEYHKLTPRDDLRRRAHAPER